MNAATPTRPKPLPFASQRTPAIIVPVMAGSLTQLQEFAALARETQGIDVLEWRVDAFIAADPAHAEFEQLRSAYAVLAATDLPVLVTVRSKAQGGLVAFSAGDYAALVTRLLDLQPAAIDVEVAHIESPELVKLAKDARVPVVVSDHDWHGTPMVSAMVARLEDMAHIGADVAKIAVTPQMADETLDLLAACHAANDTLDIPVIGIAMGELGRASRVIGQDFGSAATFAALDAASAPGQLSVANMRDVLNALS